MVSTAEAAMMVVDATARMMLAAVMTPHPANPLLANPQHRT
jgi:hypothetical protein